MAYASHDSAMVQRGLELQCDLVVKCTNADGVYDKDPNKYPDAVKYDHISLTEALQKNLQFMDAPALALARDTSLPVYICSIKDIASIATDTMS